MAKSRNHSRAGALAILFAVAVGSWALFRDTVFLTPTIKKEAAPSATLSKEADQAWKSLFSSPDEWVDYRELKQQGLVEGGHPDFKSQSQKGGLWVEADDTPADVHEKLASTDGLWRSGTPKASTKATSSEYSESLWKSLFEDPSAWTDYRKLKQIGEVKDTYPDFKKSKEASLWIDSKGLPSWVPGRIETAGPLWKLAREANYYAKQWESVFSNPSAWSDYRELKESNQVKGSHPDFKSQDREQDGEALWIDSKVTPSWVHAKIAVKVLPWHKPSTQAISGSFVDQLWCSLFEDPSSWTDYRQLKQLGEVKGSYPDFKSTEGKVLWIDSKGLPDWVPERIASAGALWRLPPVQAQCDAMWQDIFDRPEDWIDYRSAKENGQVKERHPDFKHVAGEQAAWIEDRKTPAWVNEKLRGGETPSWQQGGSSSSESASVKPELAELWDNVFERSSDWRDCRSQKASEQLHPRYPDFKRISDDKGLWLDSRGMPSWVAERLEEHEGAWVGCD